MIIDSRNDSSIREARDGYIRDMSVHSVNQITTRQDILGDCAYAVSLF